jgi:two-component system chemotaxis response regulator CheY
MGYRILIVDDSATTRAVVKKALALAGVHAAAVHEAADGHEALEQLQTNEVDLVFADLNMPRMGGDVLIEAMRQDPRLRDVPVIVISTEGSATRLASLFRHGVLAFLRKPFTPEQFKQTVEPVLP